MKSEFRNPKSERRPNAEIRKKRCVSLAPGFSRVLRTRECLNRFSGFRPAEKPLKRLKLPPDSDTRLKPGANESRCCENRRSQSRPSCPLRLEARRAIFGIRPSDFFRISDFGLRISLPT